MRIIIELEQPAPGASGEEQGVQVTTSDAQATARDAGRFAGIPAVDPPQSGEAQGAVRAEDESEQPIPAGAAPTVVDNPPVRRFASAATASANGESSS